MLRRTRDGQVMTFPSHKSHQVFVESIESSQVKSFYVRNFSLTSQVKSFYVRNLSLTSQVKSYLVQKNFKSVKSSHIWKMFKSSQNSSQVKSKFKSVLIKFSFVRERSKYDIFILFQRKMGFQQSFTRSRKIITEKRKCTTSSRFAYTFTQETTISQMKGFSSTKKANMLQFINLGSHETLIFHK
jgi:hypothetical protein